MLITKISQLTGIQHSIDILVTKEQLIRWEGGEKIQNVMGNLSLDDREFLLSGITPDEWNKYFPEDNE